MYRFFGIMILLSMWSLIVFALPHLSPDRYDFFENLNSAIDVANFRREKRDRLKSVEKCEEYAQAVGHTTWIMPLSGSRPIPIYVDCKNVINSLISGKEMADPGEFPHMAAIGWTLEDGATGYYCGGSLISYRWIVTAAHCTHGPLGKPAVVRLGSNRLSDKKMGELISIKTVVRHPGYSPPSMYADLALLKLAKKVSFGPNIKPACLHVEFDKTPTQAWATGWGTRDSDVSECRDSPSISIYICDNHCRCLSLQDDELSDVLVKVELDVIDNVRCSILYDSTTSVPAGVVPSMLCAGDPNGGWKKDTCRGDSGGPLQTYHPNGCLYELVGVTSFGKLCGTSGLPGVYTRVSHYLEWIESVVWPDNE